MLATTRITILRGTTENTTGDEIEIPVDVDPSPEVEAYTNLPASLIERERLTYDPDSGTPRVVRYLRCRTVPAVRVNGERVEVTLERNDRIRDDRTGIVYTQSRETRAPFTIGGGMARLVFDLVAP